jgi:hypothetical protein
VDVTLGESNLIPALEQGLCLVEASRWIQKVGEKAAVECCTDDKEGVFRDPGSPRSTVTRCVPHQVICTTPLCIPPAFLIFTRVSAHHRRAGLVGMRRGGRRRVLVRPERGWLKLEACGGALDSTNINSLAASFIVPGTKITEVRHRRALVVCDTESYVITSSINDRQGGFAAPDATAFLCRTKS